MGNVYRHSSDNAIIHIRPPLSAHGLPSADARPLAIGGIKSSTASNPTYWQQLTGTNQNIEIASDVANTDVRLVCWGYLDLARRA